VPSGSFRKTASFPEDFTDDLLWYGKMWVKLSTYREIYFFGMA